MDAGRIDALNAGDNCAFFKAQRDYEAQMLRRVNNVIFAVTVFVALSLIALIIGITVQAWPATGAGAVGTVVSGTAMRFVLQQRTAHSAEIDRWVDQIEKYGCPDI